MSETKNLSNKYQSKEVEEKIAAFWESRSDFKAEDQSQKPPFCIILPPPNVTGFLHIGHALNHTIQDVLTRYKRMSGYNALWLPGTDHAGISTQSVVEKKLHKEGRSRLELGRENFEKEVWDWKEEFGNRILSQMKRLGNSCDWDRLTFTLDEGVSKAVRKVFVDLYNKGLIYRGKKLVNWSPKLQTAISDIEVEHKEIKGSLWHIKYPVKGEEGRFLIAATTRPETFLGDTAIAVHPDDERYQDLEGKSVLLPLTGREIPVVFDEYVDKDFGTGVVKITPAHDFNDYEVGLRHDLEQINILNPDGSLNENAGDYRGLHVQEARKKIVEDLEEKDFIDKIEPHKQSVGHCERSGCVVEPYLSEQWFLKMNELAEPAVKAVKTGTTEFTPSLWEKTYFNWLENIQDWCISRQLWWGHRIPVWYCKDCDSVTVSETDPTSCESCGSKNFEQDSDVLDTWFSSALWPFSTLGWPNETKALETFYPTNILVTGPDIIFFWVARMMMQGLEYMKDVPFRQVYFNGIVRDSQGRKMSKSLGNSVDPVEIIETHGADALRFTLMSQLASGKDLKFSTQRLEGYRNFINKIWNATRFCLNLVEENKFEFSKEQFNSLDFNVFDRWIIERLNSVVDEVNKKIDELRFSEAASALYSFVWNDFCDWYLEFSKSRVYGDDAEDKNVNLHVLIHVLDSSIKLLHPFIPFVTEEIYNHMPSKNSESLAQSTYPNKDELISVKEGDEAIVEVDLVKSLITSVRNIRGENGIKVSQPLSVHFIPKEDESQIIIQKQKKLISKLALIESVSYESPKTYKNSAVSSIKIKDLTVEVVVPLEGLVDISEEIKRVEKVIGKFDGDIKKLEGKLSNPKFIENAPEELVQEDKQKLDDLKERVALMKEHRSRLSV
jgi:valyl-tRNA synthetase